ncbi:pyridoxal phosphate-dependent decarboxylase family protein [Chondromyces crocatus]|uniref:Amino acid decarboxylase n=1 Tax=Chondromyces crocatus TaxID=52 RepID=A0A0K1ED61_CHOCO|nr:pyridoxal-dependent decarboxylase [Chondromyces crocatus]AKT38816.1 amino acid decarboxylase [Chondromyces crocatus]
MTDASRLHEAQRGLGDMSPADFRDAGARVVDQVASYLARLETLPILPPIQPGDIRRQFPSGPPLAPEPIEQILDDYSRLIEPNITHWQHPGFMAYFASVASGPGILGEWLAAGLNSNVMFWRNAPASTEVEEVTVDWLRQLFGLPAVFDGMFTDTASVSSLLAVVAARHAVPGLDARDEGLAGRPELGRLRIYCSTETHSSVEKAAIVAGVGRAGVRRVPVDDDFRMRPELLAEAIREDRAAGWLPFCVVATIGTTSSTSIDPVPAIAAICREERLWLHVDAAYGGAAAVVPEMRPLFEGWELADSIVVNPHKWLFTPFDASLLLFRSPEVFRDAFSLVPEYLRVKREGEAHDYHEYGIQLGRRFRALKLWMLIRYFGADGLAARVREHCRMAQELSGWVDAEPGFERVAPTPFSTVCLRHVPAELAGREEDADAQQKIDALNEAILERVNRSGQIFLSHTRLRGRYTIRVTLGNPRQTMEHVHRCWTLLKEAASSASSG